MSNKTEKEIKRIFKESKKQELLESLERIMKLTEKTKTIPQKNIHMKKNCIHMFILICGTSLILVTHMLTLKMTC